MATKQCELEMLDYYRARAPLMQYGGLSPEVERMLAAYADYFGDRLADRNVLEVACGTGFWMQKLARQARTVVGTDATAPRQDEGWRVSPVDVRDKACSDASSNRCGPRRSKAGVHTCSG
jgi:hypothetical protein